MHKRHDGPKPSNTNPSGMKSPLQERKRPTGGAKCQSVSSPRAGSGQPNLAGAKTKGSGAMAATEPPKDFGQEERAHLDALAGRANMGDKAALAELRTFLDAHPEVWQKVGNLAEHTERTWLELMSDSVLGTESIKRHIDQIRTELGGPNPVIMEKLLINQAIACYLAAQHADMVLATPGHASTEQIKTRLKRSEIGQKRYLAALRMLAQLRATVQHGMVPTTPLCLYGGEKAKREFA
jgi:hypothetical protein